MLKQKIASAVASLSFEDIVKKTGLLETSKFTELVRLKQECDRQLDGVCSFQR